MLMKTLEPNPRAQAAPPSRDFAGQALELIPVGLDREGLFWIRPLHADSLRVGLPASARPAEVVVDVLKSYPLTAVAVHSSSWRHEGATTVLTYVAVVEPDAAAAATASLAVIRLCAGEAHAHGPVVEHAVRHIAWLRLNEPALGAALATWDGVLAGLDPEPFRALVLDA